MTSCKNSPPGTRRTGLRIVQTEALTSQTHKNSSNGMFVTPWQPTQEKCASFYEQTPSFCFRIWQTVSMRFIVTWLVCWRSKEARTWRFPAHREMTSLISSWTNIRFDSGNTELIRSFLFRKFFPTATGDLCVFSQGRQFRSVSLIASDWNIANVDWH